MKASCAMFSLFHPIHQLCAPLLVYSHRPLSFAFGLLFSFYPVTAPLLPSLFLNSPKPFSLLPSSRYSVIGIPHIIYRTTEVPLLISRSIDTTESADLGLKN
jgi:hypothetical protein